MRCITAICPAGPPKLSAATRSQTRKASPSETPWLGEASATLGLEFCRVSLISGSRLLRGPVMGLVRCIAAPAIEGIVEHKSCLELREIVRIHPRQSERGGEQAGHFR